MSQKKGLFATRIKNMVNFDPGKEIEKYIFSSCHERGTKVKLISTHQESNPRLWNPGSDALPLSHTEIDSMVREAKLIYDTCPAYYGVQR